MSKYIDFDLLIKVIVVGHRRSMLTMVLNSILHSLLSEAQHVAV